MKAQGFCSPVKTGQAGFIFFACLSAGANLQVKVAVNVVMSIVGHRRIATTDIYNRLAGVGVKGSTNKLSYGLHFQTLGNNLVIPFVRR